MFCVPVPGHISHNCRSAKCGNCNKRHHTSVCFKSSSTESPVDSIKSSSNTDVTIRNSSNRGFNPETPPFQSSSMTMTCNTRVGNVTDCTHLCI